MKLSPKSYALWVIVLTGLTFSFVVPNLARTGMNIVTHTYDAASENLLDGKSPYREIAPNSDRFKYAPVFALLYSPIASLPETASVLFWAFINSLVYWLGLCLWIPRNRTGFWIGFGLVLCSMELNGPLLYQQTNALLIGLSLISLHFFTTNRALLSGIFISLATALKIIPAVILLPMLLRKDRQFLLGALIGFAAAFALPILVLGPKLNFLFHQEWLSLLFGDAGDVGILDVRTVFLQLGIPAIGDSLFVAITISYLLVCLLSRWDEFDWKSGVCLFALTAILLSPRTESPTFVFAAPAFLGLLVSSKQLPKAGYLLYLIGAFFMTLSYNDIYPKALWNPHADNNHTKLLGAGLLWLIALWQSWPPMSVLKEREFREKILGLFAPRFSHS